METRDVAAMMGMDIFSRHLGSYQWPWPWPETVATAHEGHSPSSGCYLRVLGILGCCLMRVTRILCHLHRVMSSGLTLLRALPRIEGWGPALLDVRVTVGFNMCGSSCGCRYSCPVGRTMRRRERPIPPPPPYPTRAFHVFFRSRRNDPVRWLDPTDFGG